MPHARTRIAVESLIKKLTFYPVVMIQGARQVGKSFMARELLGKALTHSKYLTLDDEALRGAAQASSNAFLSQFEEQRPLIIDEAQKSPSLFDAIKLRVDRNRRPGRYVLLGSTEFSKETLIRESLTGRADRVRMFPMTLKETLGVEKSTEPDLKEVLKYLKRGGLPGLFSVRNEAERSSLMQNWIDLTCMRDIQQIKTIHLDSDICYRILEACSQLEEPSIGVVSKKLKLDPRRIKTHLLGLSQLFVVQKLDPHPTGTGQTIYLPLDCGLAQHLGATTMRLMQIFLMNERLAHHSAYSSKRPNFYFYRSLGKHMIHWIEEMPGVKPIAFQLKEEERIKKTDSELMLAFIAKNLGAIGAVFGPISEKLKVNRVWYRPIEEIA